MDSDDEFQQLLRHELREKARRKKAKSKIISRLDVMQRLPRARTDRLIEKLISFKEHLPLANKRLTLNILEERAKRFDDLPETMTKYEFKRMEATEKHLADTYDAFVKKIQEHLISHDSPLRSSSRSSLRLSSSLPSSIAPQISVVLDDPISKAPEQFVRLVKGCLQTYLERVLLHNGISTYENTESVLCESVYRQAPIHYKSADMKIVSFNPSVIEWTFDGKVYRAPLRVSSGYAQDYIPGYYDSNFQRRFQQWRERVKIPEHAQHIRETFSPSQEDIDHVIGQRNVPGLIADLENDYGALDLYFLPLSTIVRSSVDLFNLVYDINTQSLRSNIGKFFRHYILSNFPSSVSFQNQYFGIAYEDVVSDIIYQYLVEIDAWGSVIEEAVSQKIDAYITTNTVIGEDRKEFVASHPNLAKEIEDEYKVLIRNYPPNLSFKTRTHIELPKTTPHTTFRELFEKVIRPLTFLTDLGEFSLFFKAQMRTGYYNLSQFYTYSDSQLILLFPELVFAILNRDEGGATHISKTQFDEAKEKIDRLVEQSVQHTFSLMVKNANSQHPEQGCASLVNTLIATPSRLTKSGVHFMLVGESERAWWSKVTIPAVQMISSGSVHPIDLELYRPHILTTSEISLPLETPSGSSSMDHYDEESLLTLYGEYIIATRVVDDVTSIGYFLSSDVIEDVIASDSTDESVLRFKGKMHNCIAKYLFDKAGRKRQRK